MTERTLAADPAQMSDRARLRSLAVVVTAALAAGFSIGLTIPLMTLAMEARGFSATVNGLNAAMPALAILLFGRAIPVVAAKLGAVRAMASGIVLAASVLVLFPLLDHVVAWFVLRFVLGFGMAIAWVVSETWINRIATERTRGRMVATYAVLWSGGIAGGPQLLGLTGTTGWLPFVAASGLLLLALVPLFLAHRHAPSLDAQETMNVGHLGRLWRMAPVALIASFIAGFAEVGAFALFPLWAQEVGFSERGAVSVLSVFSIGGLLIQFPLGWLADRTDRERLLMGCGVLAFCGPALLPFVLHLPFVLWPLLFLSGSAVMGFYTLGLTILGQRFPPEDLAAANVIFVGAYMTGMLAGPVAGGVAFDAWTPHGLTTLLAAVFAVFVMVGTGMRRKRPSG